MDYPITYPCPTWQYSNTVSQFTSRIQFESGWARQRRNWPDYSKGYNLTFEMDSVMFATWFEWMNDNGYVYFNILLDSNGLSQEVVSIRLVSEITYTFNNYDNIVATASAERENA